MKPAGGMIKVSPILIEKSKSKLFTNNTPEYSSLGKIIEMGPDVEGFTVGQIIVYNPKLLVIATENEEKFGYIHQDKVEAVYE
jgi:hypothetical protein